MPIQFYSKVLVVTGASIFPKVVDEIFTMHALRQNLCEIQQIYLNYE